MKTFRPLLSGRAAGALALALAVSTLSIQACGDSTKPKTASGAVALSIASGDDQSAVVGNPLAQPLVVETRDRNNKPVPGVTVHWALLSTASGATLGSATSVSDAQGRATNTLTLGTHSGTVWVTADVAGKGQVALHATAKPDVATSIVKQSGDTQLGVASTAFSPFVVFVTDQFGNPITGDTVKFALTGSGTLSATSVLTTEGLAQVTLTPDTLAGPRTVTATVVVDSTTTIGPVSFSVQAAALKRISGNAQTATVNAAFTRPLVVQLFNPDGTPAVNVPINFAVASGGGTLSSATATTDATGTAQVTFTAGTTAGAASVTAKATGALAFLPAVTFTATQAAAAAAKLSLSAGEGQIGLTGAQLATPIAVLVRDQFNNPVANATVTFAVTSGGGTLSAASAKTSSAGVAQVNLTLGATPGPQTVTATVAGVGTVTFHATGETGVPATIVKVSGDAQTAPNGATLPNPLVVKVTDKNGVPVAGVPIAWSVSGNGDVLLGAASTFTDANGQAQIGVTLGALSGTRTITATIVGLTPAVSVSFTASTP